MEAVAADEAFAALAAAIFCANLDSGLAGLALSPADASVEGRGEEGAADEGVSEACFAAAARRLCSASIASFDLGFAASPPERPGLSTPEDDRPGVPCPLEVGFAGL